MYFHYYLDNQLNVQTTITVDILHPVSTNWGYYFPLKHLAQILIKHTYRYLQACYTHKTGLK